MSAVISYASELLRGLGITLLMSFCACIWGLLLTLLLTLFVVRPWKWMTKPILLLTAMLRGVPELLVLFIVYFGVAALLEQWLGHPVKISAFFSGVFALGLIFAAYAVQTFKGALLAIPAGQTEAALALGLSHWTIFKSILLPQMWRHALPGLGNLCLVLLKDSSLVSLIGLAEVMSKAQAAAHATHQPFTFYAVVALLFLMLTTLFQRGFKTVDRHANRGMNT